MDRGSKDLIEKKHYFMCQLIYKRIASFMSFGKNSLGRNICSCIPTVQFFNV